MCSRTSELFLVKPAPVISINVFNTSDKGCVNLTWEYKRPNRPQAVEIKYFLYGKAQPSIQVWRKRRNGSLILEQWIMLGVLRVFLLIYQDFGH